MMNCTGDMVIYKKIIATVFCIITLVQCMAAQEKLYVFYPTMSRPQIVQEEVEKEVKGVSVTVFGRYNDFHAKMGMDPPDACIAKPEVIKQIGGYTIVLNAVRKGSTTASYVVMSINNEMNQNDINENIVIGALDLFGRKGMKTFITRLFSTPPKLKRVTKIEDLLPLLSFNMVAGVLIEDVFVDYFKTTSQMDFNVTPISGKSGSILTVGVKDGKNAKNTVGALKKNDKTICKLFKIDGWK